MKIAAIDIGSNAARMQISSVLTDDGKISFKKVEYVRYALRLGHDVFSTGKISYLTEAKLKKLLTIYKLLMELHDVDAYMICATSALRESENGVNIVERVQLELGMKIHLITGEKEAELINNVIVKILDPAKTYLHIDVGGGSTELNIYKGHRKIISNSFKIGSVRLLEGTEKEGDWEKMRNWISQQMSMISGDIAAIGTGGNIAKLLNLSKPEPEEKSMSFDALFEMAAYVGSFSFEDRVNKLRLNTDRADVIVPAASIYLTAMELGGCKTILVPDLGLKDGIIQMLYDRHLNRKK